MFVLRTGLQGNGKTLNTIKEVDQKAAKEGRQVYFHNIKGFNPNSEVLKAAWQEFNDPHKWHELPENSIIVIDEAQTFFRVRKQASTVPEYASALETMRHRGHELHCITQSPGLIDVHFRKLCNSHIHYVRGHKGKVVKRWEFERVNPDVERKNHFQEGEASRVLLDKKYFGVYQSVSHGSEHFMRFKAPKALWVLVGCAVIFAALSWRLYEGVFKKNLAALDGEKTPVTAEMATQGNAGNGHSLDDGMLPMGRGRREPMSLEEYLALRTPRLADVPSSAPLYDELTQPQTYPKLSCIATWDIKAIAKLKKRFEVGIREGAAFGCRCNTQQGTRAMVTAEACLNYVENGAFDPAKPDDSAQSKQVSKQPMMPKERVSSVSAKAPVAADEGLPPIPKGSFGMLTSDPIGY